jgi:hypothetical protein
MKSVALPLIALIAFAGYTVSVMLQAEQSLIDFGISLMSRPDTAQVVIDFFVSIGPLVYLVLRGLQDRRKAVTSPTA